MADIDNRSLMMPRRRRTRAVDRARRVDEERALNAAARMAERGAKVTTARNKPPPIELGDIDIWDIKGCSDNCDDPAPLLMRTALPSAI